MSSWLPPELTGMAHQSDVLFYWVLGVIAVFFVLVETLLIVFLIRYRRTQKNLTGANIHGNNRLEIIWTLIPAVILVVIGAFCVPYVYDAQTPPKNPLVIKVIGHEWYWEFKYPNGLDLHNDLRIPAGQPVLFDITSSDVIHGFYIPEARLQQDALPGRQTQFWVQAKASEIASPSEYGKQFVVPCDQFCGQGHPNMVAHLTVLSSAEYNSWTQQKLAQQKSEASTSS